MHRMNRTINGMEQFYACFRIYCIDEMPDQERLIAQKEAILLPMSKTALGAYLYDRMSV